MAPCTIVLHACCCCRVLLRFEALDSFIPEGSSMSSADLTLSFVNWGASITLNGCFIGKDWQAGPTGPS